LSPERQRDFLESNENHEGDLSDFRWLGERIAERMALGISCIPPGELAELDLDQRSEHDVDQT